MMQGCYVVTLLSYCVYILLSKIEKNNTSQVASLNSQGGHSQIHRPWEPYAPSPLAAGLLIAVRFSSDMKRHVFLPVSRVIFNRSTLQKLECVFESCLCLHKCIALCKSVLCIWQRHINKFV